ncbi:MAG: sulfatase-like hydrolase/transferase [Propionibacterium sp.]
MPDRPNFLWIVSEDCPPRFGSYGDRLARTPNLDRLADRGVVFEHAYSTAPVCSPSRYSLITGMPPETNGPAQQMRALATLPDWLRTYPEILRGLGYYVTNNDKTDYNARIDPAKIWNESSSRAHWRNRPAGSPFLAVFNVNGTHESSVFTHQGAEPDTAGIRIPPYLPDVPEVRGDIARHYVHIAEMDAVVGQLLAELEQDGLSENTIVIHTSDHGGVNPRSKRFLYDEGLHVPLIISAPARHAGRFPPAGSRIDAAVSTIRIPATLVDLAGGAVPSYMAGSSLAGAGFDGAGELAYSTRDRMDERYDLSRTVRDGRFRYIRNFLPHRPWGQHQQFAWLARAYQAWEREFTAGRLDRVQEAFWHPKPGVELYDTLTDPDEVHNLAGDPGHRAIQERLAAALHEHILAVNDNGFLAEGSASEGYERSREPGRYPLGRILDLAEAVSEHSPGDLPRFLDALDDPVPAVRRWGGIGILVLGEQAVGSGVVARLERLLAEEPDAAVRVPAAETLGRFASSTEAVGELARLTGAANPVPIRLEALNALTALPLELVRAHRQAIATAAEDEQEYVRGAGRYLLLLIDGQYEPSATIFDWSRFIRRLYEAQKENS